MFTVGSQKLNKMLRFVKWNKTRDALLYAVIYSHLVCIYTAWQLQRWFVRILFRKIMRAYLNLIKNLVISKSFAINQVWWTNTSWKFKCPGAIEYAKISKDSILKWKRASLIKPNSRSRPNKNVRNTLIYDSIIPVPFMFCLKNAHMIQFHLKRSRTCAWV